jgi:glycolate oxidase iron-sulfur subunit
MRDESEVWQALLKRKGLSVTDLAGQLGVTRQHAHRLLTGRRPAEAQRDELEQALALGTPTSGNPLYGVGELDDNGELDLARGLARRMIDLFPPDRYDAIISNAGGCGSHLRHYGGLLRDDAQYAERARVWDTKLRDVHEWLVEIDCRTPSVGPFDTPTTVTYHESCHLTHGQKVVRQPRALLRLLPGVSLVELAESTWCCGAAGVYAITQPVQADQLLQRKVAHVVAAGASVLATANPGCHLQIARGLQAAGAAMEDVHPISLLALAYRRERVAAQPAGVK